MERLLSVAEAAEILRISVSWVYRNTKRGRLPHLRVGRSIRIDPRDLERWKKSQARGGGQSAATGGATR
ncbi:MAG: helix-turn-helix domain-containing protein [Candidatus Eisenbacteria sp.]|nr:helix-turn-helix domain-containing protein [Candidatus Eisenbacteria bacterium]